MDEIKQLQERIEFLEAKYKELVEEIVNSKCQCKKPMCMHFRLPEQDFRKKLLEKIEC